MTATAAERDAMRQAIALSAFGLGGTSPNPPVGCVILDARGQAVGHGYHQRKGEAHAEVNALAAAAGRARGGTAVVTLEPCNHHGRTPPCHQALLDAGIARVLIAVLDPTSRGEGGAARLRGAGVDVETGVLEDEALLVLAPWLTALRTLRPLVVWSYRIGADGRIGPVPADQAVDVVLHDGGEVEEWEAGRHGQGMVSLTPVDPTSDLDAVLADLYRAGARSVLLNGDSELAGRLAALRLVDRLVIDVQDLSPSRAAAGPLLPPGARMIEVTRRNGHVRVVASLT